MWQLQSVSPSEWNVTVATAALELEDNANMRANFNIAFKDTFHTGSGTEAVESTLLFRGWRTFFISAQKKKKKKKMMITPTDKNTMEPGRSSYAEARSLFFCGRMNVHGWQSQTMACCPSSITVVTTSASWPLNWAGREEGVIKWPPTLRGKGCARIVYVPAYNLHAYTQTEPWPSLGLHCDVSVTDGHAVRRAILSVSNVHQHTQFVTLQ